jgi:hypothetical protein
MRQARLARTAGMAEKAQMIAHERSVNMAKDINQKTDQSMDRSLEANRSMERSMALDSSVLARQGKSAPGQTQKREIVAAARPLVVEQGRESVRVNRNLVSKRKAQVDPSAAAGEDSLPPNARRALKVTDQPKKTNDPQPRLQPQQDRPVPASRLLAHGINGNPAEEARRRKKLEARIRELASE